MWLEYDMHYSRRVYPQTNSIANDVIHHNISLGINQEQIKYFEWYILECSIKRINKVGGIYNCELHA